MRIAQMIDSLNWGGAQKLLVTFARAAREHALDLTIISLRNDDHTPIPGELSALGARVVTFPGRGLFDPFRIARLVRLMRREQFDVLHTHLAYANIIGALVGKLAGTPVVATLHSTGFDARHDHPLKQIIEAFALRYGAQRVIAVGYTIANKHRARLGNRWLDIIPNAITPPPILSNEQRDLVRAQMVGDPAKTILITVGRFSPPKGYADLITAFAKLHRTHPDVALVLVGDGVLRNAIEQQIATLGLNDRVRLLGARDDVPSLLAASDMFILASHYEGLPLALLEAMAAGLPVVATNVGDVPRVVGYDRGVLVSPQHPYALANAIAELLDTPTKMHALGAAAQSHILRQFSATTWIERLIALYQETRAELVDVLPTKGVVR